MQLQGLMAQLVKTLLPTIQDLVVTLVRADHSEVTLSYGTDYTIANGNGIVLNSIIVDNTTVGDQVRVVYRYQTP